MRRGSVTVPCPSRPAPSTRPRPPPPVRLDHHQDASRLHLVAFGHVHLGDRPAVLAWTACSIFMASSTTRSWPASTTSPTDTATRPRHLASGPRRTFGHLITPSGNRSCSTNVEAPSGPSTKAVGPTQSTRYRRATPPVVRVTSSGVATAASISSRHCRPPRRRPGSTGSVEAVGDLDGRVADGRRRSAAAQTGCCGNPEGMDRCTGAWSPAPGLAGQGGGDRMPPDGVVIGERRGQLLDAVPLEEAGIGLAGQERGVTEGADQEVAVGGDAVDAGSGQASPRGRRRPPSGWARGR